MEERACDRNLRLQREYWRDRREALQRKNELQAERARNNYGVMVYAPISPPYNEVAKVRHKLTQIREKAGLRPVQLANRMQVRRSTISRMENAARSDISLAALEKFANACGFIVRVEFDEVSTEKVRYVKIEE